MNVYNYKICINIFALIYFYAISDNKTSILDNDNELHDITFYIHIHTNTFECIQVHILHKETRMDTNQLKDARIVCCYLEDYIFIFVV